MSSSRKEELLAKKARLAELKRQRELRQEQYASTRRSIGEVPSPSKTAEERRSEIDSLVSSLIDSRRESTATPSRRESRPSSVHGTGTGQTTPQNDVEPASRRPMQSTSTQTEPTDATFPIYEDAAVGERAPPKKEYITYSKGVQTEPYTEDTVQAREGSDEDELSQRSRKRLSKRDQEKDEEIRQALRREIEEEIKATFNQGSTNQSTSQQRFPLRNLTNNELNAVVSSPDFVAFVERSSKVIERALDMDDEYDLLADYTRTSTLDDDDEDDTNNPYSRTGKKAHSLRESLQLFSDRYTRRRIVSDIQFSPHFNELLLSSYTKNPSAPHEPAGLVLLWNTHAPSRPEYTFTASSDVLSARFSPFHPNLVIGGCYSGQVCLWDTRVSGRTGQPVQKTPQSGSHLGHTHPVYSISVVGTPNAHNILTASMDGVVCSWSVDMLTQAQEYLILHTPPPAKTDDLAPTSMSFPAADPTFFVVGTEEGSIYACHRYDRAGAQAGVDNRIAYRGHTAPVMSTQFHPARGPVDMGDLLLSSSSDWSVKLWRIKPSAASGTVAAITSAATTPGPTVEGPILNLGREDLVYDAKWAPHKPSVFGCVTGAGELEVFDLTYDLEVPIVKASPTRGKNGTVPFKGLNKLAWEERRGSHIAVGGLDGVVTVFDVGKGLQCGNGEWSSDEWLNMKRLVGKLKGGKS
ncbi:Cytoplasmic dynein 1 intermediate chain 2 [Exophiala dermatitidis]